MNPVIDTSMALLFLKRSDLLPDLRETLQKRLKITDPGAAPISPGEKKDSPGDNPDLKSGIKKKTPPGKDAKKGQTTGLFPASTATTPVAARPRPAFSSVSTTRSSAPAAPWRTSK